MLRGSLTGAILAGTVTFLAAMPHPAAAFTVTVDPLPTLTFPEKRTPEPSDSQNEIPGATTPSAR